MLKYLQVKCLTQSFDWYVVVNIIDSRKCKLKKKPTSLRRQNLEKILSPPDQILDPLLK